MSVTLPFTSYPLWTVPESRSTVSIINETDTVSDGPVWDPTPRYTSRYLYHPRQDETPSRSNPMSSPGSDTRCPYEHYEPTTS